MSQKKKVFIGLPARPGENMAIGLHYALKRPCKDPATVYGDERCLPCSMLPMSFNMLWCEALNARASGVTHFCMVHSDVIPVAEFWLDKLLDEQERVGADILTTVIPLKDNRGQSSTGVMNVGTREMRKLTLAECHGIRERTGSPSFDVAAAGFPGHCLLMNTGCWVCDLTKPWAERMCFRFHDHTVLQSDGKWRAACVGEDWLFSIDAHRLGLRCFASLVLPVEHQGVFQYPNITPWGTQEPDVSVAWNIEPPASWNWIESPIIRPETVNGNVPRRETAAAERGLPCLR